MKRLACLKYILKSLRSSDVALFVGDYMCKEAYQYDKDGFFYLPSVSGIGPSLALGMALGTDQRVFVFVNDDEFLKNFSTAPQIAVSKCKNIFYVIFVSGFYQSHNSVVTIFNELKAPKGIMFNLGFSVFDYTHYFKNKFFVSEVPLLIEGIKGPLALFISVDLGVNKKLVDVPYSGVEMCDRIAGFIKDNKGTHSSEKTNI
jgi:hypothetical protein